MEEREKKFSEQRKADRSLLSGVKSCGFRLPQYISLPWEEKAPLILNPRIRSDRQDC